MAENMAHENCCYMTRRIGPTTYRIKVIFDDAAKETMEEKIVRLIQMKCWIPAQLVIQWSHHK